MTVLIATSNLHKFILTVMTIGQAIGDMDDQTPENAAENLVHKILGEKPDLTFTVVGAINNSDDGWNFTLVCTEEVAREILDLEYDIDPAAGEVLQWKQPEPEGMTWVDLYMILRGKGHLPELDADEERKEMRATDDNDPHAPWFRVMGIKSDDDGIFLAIEEIQP